MSKADTTSVSTPLPPSTAKLGELRGVSTFVLALREELRAKAMQQVATFAIRGKEIEVLAGRDSLWAIVRRPGRGGLALRVAYARGGLGNIRTVANRGDEPLCVTFDSVIGEQQVVFRCHEFELPVLRFTTQVTPVQPILVPFVPRDLYPLDDQDDPTGADGEVEAAQRGLNGGISYFRMERPAFGSVLYFQNFTALNDYFRATETKPDGAVGGEWPELGFLMPTPPQSGTPPLAPLPAGEPIVVSDALLAFHEDPGGDEQEMARRFLTLLAAVYRRLEPRPAHYHDWVERAERSLRDLDNAPEATIRHYGFRYVHPYTAAEYPDAMVQLSVMAAIRDYEAWKQQDIPLRVELMRGMGKFFDPKLGTLRRYLPNVGKDKDKDAVDSWYLYHPLVNLGRLALDGDKRAERMFRKSVEFGIKAAKHFDYRWPIQYKVTDFSVIQEDRGDGYGQTDVGGIYAYVMLQAFELTDDKRFLDEARNAINRTMGARFELNYQANLTAWGAAACVRLWRITQDEAYLRQSYVFVASFFHNVAIWESDIGFARHYPIFLGVTALHDAPYMACYECFDSFAAWERYLKDSGPDLDPGIRMLISEYCRHALDRAWYYYPDALPEDAISTKVREPNGFIARNLSFPVEDLYVDGQPAGQVGQEIYGAGAAFVFSSRAFHSVGDAPFRIFCDHFLLASDRPNETTVSFQLGGGEGCIASLSLIRTGRSKLPKFSVTTMAGDRIRPAHENPDRVEFHVPADGRVTVAW